MLFTLAVALSVLVPGQSKPPPITTVGPPTVVTDADLPENQPPPGSREDQALWRAAHAQYGESQIQVERARVAIVELRTGDYRARLSAAGKAAGGDGAQRADGLWTRLAAAADDAYAASSKPPFNLRTGCRYDLLRFGQVMGARPGDRAAAANLAETRGKLRVCHGRLDRWVRPLVQANGRLEAALHEAKEFVAAHPAGAAAPVEPASAQRPATGG